MRVWVFAAVTSLFVGGCRCLKRHESPKLVVMNVLDEPLYVDCHIAGSINVPFETVESYAKKLPIETHIVVYCSNYKCTASVHSARVLKALGFKQVWAYEAGMAEWYQQKLPVEGACKQAYLTMQNDPIVSDVDKDVRVISTSELRDKMALFGLIEI